MSRNAAFTVQSPVAQVPQPAILQRKCACGTHTPGGGTCESCAGQESELRRRATGASPGAIPALVHEVLRSPGDALDAGTRAFFEPRFGGDFTTVGPHSTPTSGASLAIVPENHPSERAADAAADRIMRSATSQTDRRHDFGGVRVHTDATAAASARTINARAYTVGNHIVFADGQYDRASTAGRELLAHELAHVASPGAGGALNCKRFDTNETACTGTMTYLVQLLYDDTGSDTWTTARKTSFRSGFKSQIENTFNANTFAIKPAVSSYDDGWISTDIKTCPCATAGFKPRVQIDLVEDDAWSTGEDWEVDVAANSSGTFVRSKSGTSYGNLNEASNTAYTKGSSAPGVKQVPTVHEFGHFLGLEHPGEGLAASKLSAGASEYSHVGKDKSGHDVDGGHDLMGGGMGLRAFYFDNWREELGKKYGKDCGWDTK
jgi:hypothetical protein